MVEHSVGPKERRQAQRPPRVLFPFWIQLLSSFMIILLMLGGSLGLAWPYLEQRVVTEARAFITMSAAEMGASLLETDELFRAITPQQRRQNMAMREIQDRHAAHLKLARAGNGTPMEAKPFTANTDLAKTIIETQLNLEGDFAGFVLDFSVLVPTERGWVRWLCSDPDRVDEVVSYGNFIESYALGSSGWDNFLSDRNVVTVQELRDGKKLDEFEERRRVRESPPREGINIARDPFISARFIGDRIEEGRTLRVVLPEGADLTRAVFVAEYPHRFIAAPRFMAKVIFVAVLVVSGFLALIVAGLITWRMNRPISRLYEAMLKISAGEDHVRVRQVRMPDEFGRLSWQFNRMMDELGRTQEITASVAVASRIQRELIPDPPKALPGFDIAAWYQPTMEVGGDYYDFIQRGKYLWVALGDAVGHGVESGLIMASARAMLRTTLEYEDSPAKVMAALNRLLCEDLKNGNFLTGVILRIDLETGRMDHCSAGHEPLLLVSGKVKRAKQVRSNCPPLGVLKELTYKDAEPEFLLMGDVVLISSDGVRECHNERDELFGMERLIQAVTMECICADDVMASLVRSLDRHRGNREVDDDISVVVIKAKGNGTGPA